MIIQVKGFNEIQKKYAKLFPKIVQKLADITEQEIKNNIKPFSDSGNLMKSIKVETDGNKLVVSSNVPYAKVQNEGGTYKPTEKQKKKFWSLFYSTNNQKYKASALAKSITVKAKHYTDVEPSIIMGKIKNFLNKIIK